MKSTGKAKERATEERVSMKAKKENFGRKGKQHETRTRKDDNNVKGHELGRMAPNMRAGGSYTQAISDPKKEEKRETRGLRWADCEEEREQEKEKETRQETGQEELMSEKPPGLEQSEESEHERKEEK